jgi:hypothetical protein
MKREDMDQMIRDTVRQKVAEQEPAAEVRAKLLAKAEAHNAEMDEMVVGASIPPLVNGLREAKPLLSSAVRLPELETELMDFFGVAQQRLITVWLLSSNSRY